MVLFFSSTALAPTVAAIQMYMGADKVENELLIKFAYPNDIWFHVDKISSAHVYLRLPTSMSMEWDKIPEALLNDAAQLVKANSVRLVPSSLYTVLRSLIATSEGQILGNKQNNVAIIYTPASNLKKSGDMAVGQVGFVQDRQNKTKIARAVDHEADKIEREKEAAKERRATAVTRANEELSLARERKAKSEARSYSNLFEKKGTAEEEDHDWNSRQKEGDFDPEEDFM